MRSSRPRSKKSQARSSLVWKEVRSFVLLFILSHELRQLSVVYAQPILHDQPVLWLRLPAGVRLPIFKFWYAWLRRLPSAHVLLSAILSLQPAL